MAGLLMLSESDVRAVMDLQLLHDQLVNACIMLAAGEVSVPPRVAARTDDGLLGAMPGYVPGLGLAAKLVSVFPHNGALNLPTHQAIMVTFDSKTGTPEAIVASAYLTAIRTAMTVAIAAEALAIAPTAPKQHDIAIIGAGAQGAAHIEAFIHLFPSSSITIVARHRERAEAVAATFPGRVHVASTIAEVIENATVICCCTDATEPLLDRDALRPGTFVSSVGTNRELPAALIDDAWVYVESKDATLPPPAGAVELQGREPSSIEELGKILSRSQPSVIPEEVIRVFKSTGHAVEDIAASRVVIDQARMLERGIHLSIA